LTRHQLTSHLKERPFACSFLGCESSFALKHHLTRHEKLHADPKPFACTWPGCLETFSKHEQLRVHVCLEHTGEPAFTCALCDNLEFRDKASFRRHERSVHSGRVYLCGLDGCGKTFPKWSLAVLHRKTEHQTSSAEKINDNDENALMCDECGKGPFKSEASYKQHSKTHSLSPSLIRHPCPLCIDKEFSSRSGLKAHGLAVHSTTLPFVCETCGKGYGYKKLLKRHMERFHSISSDNSLETISHPNPSQVSTEAMDTIQNFHFREKDLPCPIKNCNRRFFRQYDLDRHMQSLHTNFEIHN
jgi:general transcription factor IIIA